MKNADMPAMPMGQADNGGCWLKRDLDGGYAEQCKPAFGLTKREMFAMHFMQAWIQHHGSAHDYGFDVKNTALSAIECADVLLAELESGDANKTTN